MNSYIQRTNGLVSQVHFNRSNNRLFSISPHEINLSIIGSLLSTAIQDMKTCLGMAIKLQRNLCHVTLSCFDLSSSHTFATNYLSRELSSFNTIFNFNKVPSHWPELQHLPPIPTTILCSCYTLYASLSHHISLHPHYL